MKEIESLKVLTTPENLQQTFTYYLNRSACAIPDGTSVILTGGFLGPSETFSFESTSKVTRYINEREIKELPGLNYGRHSHGCAGFSKDSEQVNDIIKI